MPVSSSKSALVLGAGGFIASHLVSRLKAEGFWVRGVDLKFHEFSETEADDFVIGDLRDVRMFAVPSIDTRFDEVYQLAADMGGAGYMFTGDHDADMMHNSATINLNVARRLPQAEHQESCSTPLRPACIPAYNQEDPHNPKFAERLGLSRRARQRIWLGEAFQRAALPGVSP